MTGIPRVGIETLIFLASPSEMTPNTARRDSKIFTCRLGGFMKLSRSPQLVLKRWRNSAHRLTQGRQNFLAEPFDLLKPLRVTGHHELERDMFHANPLKGLQGLKDLLGAAHKTVF